MKNAVRISRIILVILSIFLIHSCEEPTPPIITTTAVTAISYTTTTSGGEVTNEGGTPVTARGVCWNTSADPTVANNKTTDGTGTGSFTSSLTGLIAGTTYYVKAYATNVAGTGYGSQVTFTTSQIALATLTTTAITAITQTTAVTGGNITADNGATISARGVCWGTVTNPTTANNKTTDGTGTGSFVSNLISLQPGTIYYVRSYATNSIGTSYGNEISFTTTVTLPVLTTTAASSITQTTTTSGGNVTSDGGATVTARGVCWATTSTPTIANNKTTDGTGTGSFTSAITGLTPGATYYIRAYATNSTGTAYGNEVSFSALANLPTLTTTAVTSIGSTTASSGGNISADGGATITARGVCWSTSSAPTTANFKTTDGTSVGSFTSSLTGLTAYTTYYLRVYATNSAGTAYGTQVSFTTQQVSGSTVTDIDGNVYNTVTIGTQVWMGENLMTTKYNDGTAIPLVTVNSAWGALTTGAYCWNNNNAATSYGARYNWYTYNTGKLCPTGWHVPSNDEWAILANYLGGASDAGGKLKEMGTTHWASPNTGATNETGFSALPGGCRNYLGAFYDFGSLGYWWSSTEHYTYSAWAWGMSYSFSSVGNSNYGKQFGFSVRCIKDN